MKTIKNIAFLIILFFINDWNLAQTFHYVTVGNNYFNPDEITIQVGDTVRWINGVDGGGVHNVVADDSTFTSGPLSYPWAYDYVFSTAGVFPYQCSEHGASGMTGVVTVESATGIKDDDLSIFGFELKQNYPNPFNPTTKISWQSPVSGYQLLKVYDVLGNEIASLVHEIKPAGNYEIEFDGSKLSSGVYYYQLQIGNLIETKKLTLLK